ncbi:MAG TPA: HlyD family efflux transporter periplasmic adaptor subunit [Phycisphaerae bacterium]|nr:HlyD family efflux transporter periplasmic adaptor subunit [Phycisphaerae bacterium]
MLPRIIVFVVVIAGLTGLLLYVQHKPRQEKISGFIEAHDIRVGSRVGGRIAKVLVAEGQGVKAGDLLLELEPFDLQERQNEARALLAQREEQLKRMQAGNRPEEVAQAEARRAQLAAKLEELKAGPRPQEIAEAQALMEYAQTQVQLSQDNYNRIKKSFEGNAVTQDEMDRATNQLRDAQAGLIVRRERLGVLKEGSRKEDIAAAEAQLAEANSALDLMKAGSRVEDIAAAKAAVEAQKAVISALDKQIAELKISAPADGTIEAVDIRPGDLLPANAPALSLLETSEMWVRAYLPENRELKAGSKVRVTVDSSTETFSGEVTFVSRDAEFTPGNVQTPEERSKQVFRIRVTLDERARKMLRAGMSADVWLK